MCRSMCFYFDLEHFVCLSLTIWKQMKNQKIILQIEKKKEKKLQWIHTSGYRSRFFMPLLLFCVMPVFLRPENIIFEPVKYIPFQWNLSSETFLPSLNDTHFFVFSSDTVVPYLTVFRFLSDFCFAINWTTKISRTKCCAVMILFLNCISLGWDRLSLLMLLYAHFVLLYW